MNDVEIPEIIEIKPVSEKVPVGGFSYSGNIKGNDGKVIDTFSGNDSLNIPGDGCFLNLNDEKDKRVWNAIQSKTLYPNFSGVNGARFKILNHKEITTQKIAHGELAFECISYLTEMSKNEKLTYIALHLGETYSNNRVAHSEMVKKCMADSQYCEKILSFKNDGEKELKMLVQQALLNGNSETKNGLYKNNGVYFIGDITVGLTIDEVLVFIKKEENKNLLKVLKEKFKK